MKIMAGILAIVVLVLGLTLSACAMGPIYLGDHTVAWDPSPGATGYFIYWRAPGTEGWDDTKRARTLATELNLLNTSISSGEWQICATAYLEELGKMISESGPSNIVTWKYIIVGNPVNMIKK